MKPFFSLQTMNSRLHILRKRVFNPRYNTFFEQSRHFRTSHLSNLALYRWQYEDLNQWNYGDDGILDLASEIFKDLENEDIPSALSNHLFHTVVRMKRNLKESDDERACDLNMLLAICKSSYWFTEKQNRHFSFVNDGLGESNENLRQQLDIQRSELERLRMQLESAQRELAEAKGALAESEKRSAVMKASALQAAKLLTANIQTAVTPNRPILPATNLPKQANKQPKKQPNKQARKARQPEPDYSYAYNSDDD
jgi:hypothetical protein